MGKPQKLQMTETPPGDFEDIESQEEQEDQPPFDIRRDPLAVRHWQDHPDFKALRPRILHIEPARDYLLREDQPDGRIGFWSLADYQAREYSRRLISEGNKNQSPLFEGSPTLIVTRGDGNGYFRDRHTNERGEIVDTPNHTDMVTIRLDRLSSL